MSSQSLKAVATGAAEAPRDPYQGLKNQLERSKGEFLPLFGNSQSNVDAFVRVVLNAVMANPDLLHADRRSLIASCMKAAQDGLMPDGREAVLNIYSTKVKTERGEQWVQMVQYLPMVGGLIKLLYASGEVKLVDAAAVYENDRFVYRRGDSPVLEHEPTLADDPGRIVAAYVVVHLTNGAIKREVMPRRDIEAVRAVSKSGNGVNSPWVKWYDQQAIKSVIKRAYKQLPRNDKFERAEKSDNDVIGFAATPTSVADIAARNAPAALGYHEADTLDFGVATHAAEPVEAEQQQATPAQARTARRAPAAPPAAKSFGDFNAAIEAAPDEAAARLLMDEAKASMSPEHMAQLQKTFEMSWS